MPHPLARLTADEIASARDVLVREGLVAPATRFPYLGLEEPPKDEVLRYTPDAPHTPDAPPDRKVRAVLLDIASGEASTAVVSLTRELVERIAPLTVGQPPVLEEEYPAVEEIVKADARFAEAMHRRGIEDLDLVRVAPLSAGDFGIEGEAGRRMLRALLFLQNRPDDPLLGAPRRRRRRVCGRDRAQGGRVPRLPRLPRPVGGRQLRQAGDRARHAAADPDHPAGRAFVHRRGRRVSWENWSLRVASTLARALTLHQLSFAGRPIVYRASIAEMVVPYGDPSPTHFWQNYFDAGEYLLGQSANSLEMGCDCVGEIHYFDAVLADGNGNPRRIVTRSACTKRTTASSGSTPTSSPGLPRPAASADW